jgi:hypothetical protein
MELIINTPGQRMRRDAGRTGRRQLFDLLNNTPYSWAGRKRKPPPFRSRCCRQRESGIEIGQIVGDLSPGGRMCANSVLRCVSDTSWSEQRGALAAGVWCPYSTVVLYCIVLFYLSGWRRTQRLGTRGAGCAVDLLRWKASVGW